MQDDGSAKGMNASLEKHWEKIAVVAVLAVLVVYIGAKAFGEGQGAAKVIIQLKEQVERQKNSDNPTVSGPPGINVGAPAAPTASVPLKNKWINSHRPPHFVEIVEIKDVELSFLPPDMHLDGTSVEVDGVEITWSVAVLAPEAGVKQVPLKPETLFFIIDRRMKDKNWETQVQLKLKEMVDAKSMKDAKEFKGLKYKDGKTLPKSDYEYRITMGSDDNQYRAKVGSGKTARIIGPVAIRTLGLFEFAQNFSNIQGADPDAVPPKDAQVYIKIVKYDPEYGKVEWAGIHKVGDKIGWSTEEDGKTRTSKHLVPTSKRGQRQALVDFDTGAEIKDIKTDQVVVYEYKACQPNVNGCTGPTAVKDQYKVNRVQYIDEDKVQQSFEVPSGMGKRADYFCELHGGAAAPVKSPEEKKAEIEASAQELLEKADKGWKSEKASDKASAQKIYKELLLPPYSDTQVVKAKRSEIETRSKEKLK